jgi:hypothetical protein
MRSYCHRDPAIDDGDMNDPTAIRPPMQPHLGRAARRRESIWPDIGRGTNDCSEAAVGGNEAVDDRTVDVDRYRLPASCVQNRYQVMSRMAAVQLRSIWGHIEDASQNRNDDIGAYRRHRRRSQSRQGLPLVARRNSIDHLPTRAIGWNLNGI